MSKIISDIQKVQMLQAEVGRYMTHLSSSIISLANPLPKVARKRLSTHHSIDIDKMLTFLSKGQSFYTPSDNEFIKGYSGDQHPNLYAALEKYQIVKTLQEALNTTGISDQQKLGKFKTILTTSDRHYKTNREHLTEHRDKGFTRFLSNVLHILSLGLYSKYSKGTFKFWQSHGESFVQNAEHIESQNTLSKA